MTILQTFTTKFDYIISSSVFRLTYKVSLNVTGHIRKNLASQRQDSFSIIKIKLVTKK